MYSGPLPCFPPGVCLSGEWARGPEHKLLLLCCFPKKRQIVPRSAEQKEQSLVCLSSSSDFKPSAGRPTNKEAPQCCLHPSSLCLSLPPLQEPSQWLYLQTTKPVAVPTDRHLVAQSLETHELFSEAKRQDVGRSIVRVIAATTSSHRSLSTT